MTKFTKWKKWQKLIQGLYPNHMHISRPSQKHVRSFIKIGIKLYEELCSQGTNYLYTFIESEVRNDKVHKVEKVTKINSRIIWYPNHPQTMGKTCAKFQKDRYKIVWVALTRYTLSIQWGRKVHKVEKVTKNNLTIISKPHAHPHTLKITPAKFQKDWYKTVRGVALTKHPG